MSDPIRSVLIQDAIRRAAEEDGIDPATALAYADRESSFNPSARASKTIRGLYQMSGDLRAEHGIGDTTDPYEQTKGFNRYFTAMKGQMAKRLGRDPTDTEAYAGHHFGPGRGARMFSMHPDTPVDQVFTSRELAENPHIVKAGSVGALLSGVTGDIDSRRTKFGAMQPNFDMSGFEPVEEKPLDMTHFEPVAKPSLDLSQFAPAP